MRVESNRDGASERRPRDEAASAVEFALVLPFLLMLVFGMLTGGLALNSKLGVEQANREAARWAATLPLENCGAPEAGPPVIPDDCWFADVANNAVLSANGELGDGLDDRFVCVAFIHHDGAEDHSKSLTWDGVTAAITSTNETSEGSQCFADGLSPNTAHVQVQVARPGWLNIIFLSRSFTMESRSVAMFEPPLPYS